MPDQYRSATLGDLCQLQRGFDLPADMRRKGTVPVVSSGGITGTHDEAAVDGPGVVTGRYGTIGEVYYIDGPFWPLNTTLWVKDFKGNSPRFVAHVLRGVSWSRLSDKTGVPGINRNDAHKLPVTIPGKQAQNYIAEVLDMASRGESLAVTLRKRRRKLKRGLLQQLLTGERRFPEFRDRPRVERRFGDVLKETSRLLNWNDDEHYRLASIRRGSRGLFDRGSRYGRDIKVKKLHTIREGDFLISHIQAAYGAMGTVPAEFDGAKVSDMYSILTPKEPGRIDMRFINYLSQRKEMRHMAYISSNGFFAERLRLNFDPHDFLNRTLLLPPEVAEQSKIADALETLDHEIQLLTDLHAALKEQKMGLMQQLLTGKVRVPASMLQPQEVS